VSTAIISNISNHTSSTEEEEQDADKTMEAPTLGMQQRSQSEQPSLEEFLSYVGLEKLLPVLQVRPCC